MVLEDRCHGQILTSSDHSTIYSTAKCVANQLDLSSKNGWAGWMPGVTNRVAESWIISQIFWMVGSTTTNVLVVKSTRAPKRWMVGIDENDISILMPDEQSPYFSTVQEMFCQIADFFFKTRPAAAVVPWQAKALNHWPILPPQKKKNEWFFITCLSSWSGFRKLRRKRLEVTPVIKKSIRLCRKVEVPEALAGG